MVEEKKRYESGAVVAAVLGVAAGVGILAIAAAASTPKPKPKPVPVKKGCTGPFVENGATVDCFQPGPDSLMEFRMPQGFYINSMDLEVDLTGISAFDGTQKNQVTVRVLVLDEVGTLKKMFELFDFATPTTIKTSLPSVGVIGRSVLVEAVSIVDVFTSSAPIIGAPYQGPGPRALTLTKNGRLKATVM